MGVGSIDCIGRLALWHADTDGQQVFFSPRQPLSALRVLLLSTDVLPSSYATQYADTHYTDGSSQPQILQLGSYSGPPITYQVCSLCNYAQLATELACMLWHAMGICQMLVPACACHHAREVPANCVQLPPTAADVHNMHRLHCRPGSSNAMH